METLQRTANRGSVSTGFNIDNSVKLEDTNTEYLQRAASGSDGDRRTMTLSMWLKRTAIGNDHIFYSQGSHVRFRWKTSDYFSLRLANGHEFENESRLFRDPSAWYHMVVAIDTTQSTDTNRVKIYWNGVQETTFNTAQYPDQNEELTLGQFSSVTTQLGWFVEGGYGFDGYISEVNYIDGLQKAPTDFGEFDSDSGIWIPKQYTGSYGSEGFFLNFDDSSSMGADSSGNSNNFNLNNVSAADQATDTPTNNFCTWSPLWAESRANGTITEGATQVAWGGGAWKIARSSMAVSKGRWYWEIKGANVTGDTWNNNLFGFASVEGDDGQYGPTVLLGYSTGNYYYRVANSQTGQDNWGDAGGAWSSSDTFGFALDLESSTKKFILYRNGSAVNGSGTDLVSAFQTEQFFTPYSTSYNGDTQFLNWGGYTVNTISSAATDANGYGTFEYAPPSGYYAICTKNLAEYG